MIGTQAVRSDPRTESWKAGADLSSHQFYFVKQNTTGEIVPITSVVDIVCGVLDNDPEDERMGRVIVGGIAKVVSDGSSDNIGRGDPVEADSTGRAVQSNSNKAVGWALTPSTAAGTLISVRMALHPFQRQGDHLAINSDPANKKQVRIGSQTSVATSDTHMGFSSKPRLDGVGTANITGAEMSPRVQNSGAGGAMYGIDINPIVKSDAAVAALASMAGLKVKLESSGVHTFSGNVQCLLCEPAFTGNDTISGKYVPISIRDNTQQGTGKNWDAAFMIGGNGGIAHATTSPSSTSGRIKVLIGTTERWIQLYSSGTGG